MKRLLVISYHYPSDGEVGGLRWGGFTKYLHALGWQSWILTAAPPPTGPLLPGVTVESIPPARVLTHAYHRMRQALEKTVLSPRQESRAGFRPLGTLRDEVSGLFTMWHEGHGWMLRALFRARAMIARIKPDVVVTTSPPHLTHLVGWLATRGTGTRWIVDFRDPWAGPLAKALESDALRRSAITKALIRAGERLAIQSADQVFTTTRELALALSAKYPGASVTWLPNSVDAELLPQRPSEIAGFDIAHVGTMYMGRDMGPVLRGLRMFLDRHPDAASDGAKLRQVGDVEPPQAAAIMRDVTDLKLGKHVALQGIVPRATALEILAGSRLALVLAQDGTCQVPAKLYEAVTIGVPTLVVAPKGSAAAREATRVGAMLADPNDASKIADVLSQLWLNPNETGAAAHPEFTDHRGLAPCVSALLQGEQWGGDARKIAPRPRSESLTEA